jgi:hypothetical protein
MKVAIYTSIFGAYDELIDDQFTSPSIDYICFSDMEYSSKIWRVIKSTPIYDDSNRNAKKYKILPHRYLKDYDVSIWIDGNVKVINDPTKLIDKNPYKVFDHNQNILDPRDCIYKEANAIIQLGNENMQRTPEKGIKNYKDSPNLIINQVQRYQKEGYPANNGLATNSIILRWHNQQSVIDLMEDWWQEIKHNSKRDQLSFDYVCWKNNFKYKTISGDSRNNEYFISLGPHKGKK